MHQLDHHHQATEDGNKSWPYSQRDREMVQLKKKQWDKKIFDDEDNVKKRRRG